MRFDNLPRIHGESSDGEIETNYGLQTANLRHGY